MRSMGCGEAVAGAADEADGGAGRSDAAEGASASGMDVDDGADSDNVPAGAPPSVEAAPLSTVSAFGGKVGSGASGTRTGLAAVAPDVAVFGEFHDTTSNTSAP